MTSIPSPTLRRIAGAVSVRRCCAIACICLIIAAAALRFYDISKDSVYRDEAISAVTSRGAISEVIANSRHYPHSSPILYPLALWAIQKAASTEFSVRLLPATSSALTVAALLFLMPRVGVPRRAAFLAALLATLSVAAIEHAQDGREYSVDALIAALIIAGLLQYLRNGGKALLCASLIVAPLLQYGLVLFGVAALATAALAPVDSSATLGGRRTFAAAIWESVRRRIALVFPIVCFAAGCALSWELTARYHWTAGGWGSDGYLADFYYQGGYDATAIAEFAFNRTWSLLIYHMPPVISAAALLAFGALLPLLLKRRRCDAIALLCLIAIGVAICAAVMNLYPFGGSRHSHYLGPLIFLAAGNAFHALADDVAAIARRAWLAPALAAAAAVAIVLAGVAAIWQDNSYTAYSQKDASMKQALATLEERELEGDAVYVARWEVPAVEFYKGDKPANYFYGKIVCWGASGEATLWAECVPEVMDEIVRVFNNSKRIWLIHNKSSVPKEMAAYSQEIDIEVDIEEVSANGLTTLYLITGFDEVAANIRKEWLAMYDAVASDAPSAVSAYNLYLQGNALHYAKQPCAPTDTDARFFLHIYPAAAADLPAWRQQRGFDNLDFDFHEHGLIAADKCLIRRALPDYAIDRIHAGQYIPGASPTWEVEFPFNP